MILWNNVNLKDKGIIVEKTPTISKGKKRIDTYDIEGRNGVLVVDNGTYDAFVLSIDCHFDINNYSIDTIKEFLDGYGTLSIDGVKEYTAIIQNQIEFEKVLNFKKFIIQFLVNPIARDINSTTYTVSSASSTLTINSATYNMNPNITIQGTGDVSITFNNKTFYLYELDSSKTYTLDCENKIIVDASGNNCSNQMKYDFPYLKKGENTISYTGTISKFEIEYKKAYL